MNRAELEIELIRLEKESMQCKERCDGVRSSIKEGVLPRYSMISDSGDKINCIVVSLAPPKTAARDQKMFAETRDYEEAFKQYHNRVKSSTFYSKLDTFRNELGLNGSTIWTTLCKCERIKGKKLPSETIQKCAQNHLTKELELIDKSAPIVAVGNRVFRTLKQNFPERFVLNVPTPDGSRGDFQKTMDNKKLLRLAKTRIAQGQPGALCLCPPCARKYFSGVTVN